MPIDTVAASFPIAVRTAAPSPTPSHASAPACHDQAARLPVTAAATVATPLSAAATATATADTAAPTPVPPVARTPGTGPTPAAQAAAVPTPPAPDWFRVGFDSLQLSRETMASILAEGRPFAADVDAKCTEILGRPLRAGGLEALFARAWPAAVWVVSYEEVDEQFNEPRFTLSALDRLGKVVFDVKIGFMRRADGSLDMHAAGADVDQQHRGFGITAYSELLREKILQVYSQHPQSYLSLQASSAPNANTGADQAPSGYFLHALRGYVLSDSQHVEALPYPRDTPDGEADRDLSQLALLAKYFKVWAQKNYPEATDANCTALTSVCSQPYDYTQMTFAGLPVGQAYLLSGEAPAWYGVHFVNPPASITAADASERQRHRSKQIWDKQLGREIASANKRRVALQEQLWRQVNDTDAQQRAEGYTGVGMHGHPALVDFLQTCQAQESAPQACAALQEAIALLRGDKIDAGLRAAVEDPARTQEVRQEMQKRLVARGAA